MTRGLRALMAGNYEVSPKLPLVMGDALLAVPIDVTDEQQAAKAVAGSPCPPTSPPANSPPHPAAAGEVIAP